MYKPMGALAEDNVRYTVLTKLQRLNLQTVNLINPTKTNAKRYSKNTQRSRVLLEKVTTIGIRSASQEIQRHLRKANVHYRVDNIPHHVPILCQIN